MKSTSDEHGVGLIQRVIDRVRRVGLHAEDTPALVRPAPLSPETIARLRFPNGERPSPSLRAWLAFDASWLRKLGWFDAGWLGLLPFGAAPGFAKRKLGAFARAEYGARRADAFASFERYLGGDVYLLPQGADSRRALYVGATDSRAEHPVLVTDNDDLPYVALMYPGFDVYMATLVGVIAPRHGTYEALHDDATYGPRLAEHARINFGGRTSYEFGEALDHQGRPAGSGPPWRDGDAVPPGFAVVTDPFTRNKHLVPRD